MEHGKPVVELNGVSKRFFLHRQRQLLAQHALKIVRDASEPFWALKDVSFQIREGERVAILGPNGAGKTTLLRMIAGVAHPTSGSVRVHGRVSAMLALGTGLHLDLTGRENVQLIASLMGMSRAEVEAKFDAIVEFSDLARFIDEPVRTYSSGMVARLGFSVAIHSDPDILVLDEVLSVGDRAFRKQSAEQLNKFLNSASTLVLVSHNLKTAASLCSRALWLDHGTIQLDGPIDHVLQSYAPIAAPGNGELPDSTPVPIGMVED